MMPIVAVIEIAVMLVTGVDRGSIRLAANAQQESLGVFPALTVSRRACRGLPFRLSDLIVRFPV